MRKEKSSPIAGFKEEEANIREYYNFYEIFSIIHYHLFFDCAN